MAQETATTTKTRNQNNQTAKDVAVKRPEWYERLDEEQKQEVDKITKEIATIGDGQVFLGRDEQGYIRTIKGKVALKKGVHFIKISGKFTITSQGYNELNRIANISLVKPPSIVVDGRDMPNPYIERDSETKCVDVVHIRIVGIGFAPTGNLVIVDKSLIFNLTTYFIQDIAAKTKKFPVCGCWGIDKEEPTAWQTKIDKWVSGKNVGDVVNAKPTDTANLQFIPVKKAGNISMGLWVDFAHPEIQAAFNEFTSRMKFAERIADTICSRNVLKAHPSIGLADISDKTTEKDPNQISVMVYGFKHDMSIRSLREICTAGSQGDIGKVKEIAGASVETIAEPEPEVAEYEEVSQAAEEVAADEQVESKKESEKKAEKVGKKKEKSQKKESENAGEYMVKLQEVAQKIGPDKVTALANNLGFSVNLYTDLSEEQGKEVFEQLQRRGEA